MRETMENRGTSLVRTIALSAGQAVAGYDLTFLSDFLAEAVKSDPEIIYCLIMDQERHVLAHPDKDKLGYRLNDELARESAEMLWKDVPKIFSDNNAVKVFFLKRRNETEKTTMLEVVSPVYNGDQLWGLLRCGYTMQVLNSKMVQDYKNWDQQINAINKYFARIMVFFFSLIFSVTALFTMLFKPLQRYVVFLIEKVHLIRKTIREINKQEIKQTNEWLLLEISPETDSLCHGDAVLILRIHNKSGAVAQRVGLHIEQLEDISWVSTDFVLPGLMRGHSSTELRLDFHIDRIGRYVINGTLTALDQNERHYEWPVNFVLHVDEKGKPYQLTEKQYYVVGPRLSNDLLFVGRKQLLNEISLLWQEPANKEALLLIGLRRMGKSSLLEKIRRDGINGQIIPILIDLQGKDTPLTFLRAAAEAMATELHCAPPALEQNNLGPSFEQFFHSLIPQLAGRYFLLMIDEANFFAQRNYSSLPDLLRSLMQAPDVPLLLLFCGTHELRQGARDYDSILYNTTRTKNISYFNATESAEVLTRPVQDFLEYDPQALQLAFQLTHGHPLLLQALGDQLIQSFNDTVLAGKERSNYVTYGDMEQAGQQLSRKENPAFGNYWEDADTAKQKVLVVMASSLDETSRKRGSLEFLLAQAAELRIAMERKETFNALDQLTQEELLLYADSGYSFMVALYRRWLLWHYPPERFRESL